MITRVDVPDVAHVGRQDLVVPPIAADQEGALGGEQRRAEEELLDPCLTVGQPVSQERQVGPEAVGAGHRVVRGGIERVVDGHAAARTEAPVGVDDGRPAPVGEHEVELGQHLAQRMRRAARPGRVLGGDAAGPGEKLRRPLDAVVRAVALAVVLVGGAMQVFHVQKFGAPAVEPGQTST